MPQQRNGDWGRYVGLGLEIAAGVGLGVAVGWWLDGRFDTRPWWTVICAAGGLAGGLYLLIKEAIRLNRN